MTDFTLGTQLKVMGTILQRRLFSRTVSITGGAAISLAAHMRAAPAVTGTTAWGLNADGSISMDSFEGNSCMVTPASGIVYFGYDARVADADTASSYKGASATIVGEPFELASWCRGIVDAENIFFYSPSTQNLGIIFNGF
jgi:hypothetical protein